MIRVLIADDSTLFREGIRNLLEKDSRIKVCATAENGREALTLCRKTNPDVVLMDLIMPFCDGIEATKLIKSEFKNIKVIILTVLKNDFSILQCRENGADAYIFKDIEPRELISTVKSIYDKNEEYSRNILNSNQSTPVSSSGIKRQKSVNFTHRERDIIELIVQGKTNKEISSIVHLSEGRVRNIISETLYKAQVNDRTQLAVYAIANNIILPV